MWVIWYIKALIINFYLIFIYWSLARMSSVHSKYIFIDHIQIQHFWGDCTNLRWPSHNSSSGPIYKTIFWSSQPPAATDNSAALPPRGVLLDCEWLRWFYRSTIIKWAGPMTQSHTVHSLTRSIFNCQVKQHWSHQKCCRKKIIAIWKVGLKLLHISWVSVSRWQCPAENSNNFRLAHNKIRRGL